MNQKNSPSNTNNPQQAVRFAIGTGIVAVSLALTQSSVRQKVASEVKQIFSVSESERKLTQNQDIHITFLHTNNSWYDYDEDIVRLHNFAQRLTAYEKNTAFRRYFLSQILQESRWNTAPTNINSSAKWLGQIIWEQTAPDMVLSQDARWSRYIGLLRELHTKDDKIFEYLPQSLQKRLYSIINKNPSPKEWNVIIDLFKENIENPEVNLLLSYMILRLKLWEVVSDLPGKWVLYENFYYEYLDWEQFLWSDYGAFVQRVQNMNEDEIKMLVATGRYNGSNRIISSPCNDCMLSKDENNKIVLPEYIQHMNRISFFAQDYENSFINFSIHQNDFYFDKRTRSIVSK